MILISLLISSACEKDSLETAVIVKDCTGTYLRQDGKDFHVCNTDKLEFFSDGETVSVTFKKIDACGEAIGLIVCDMLHESEGWVQVLRIN